MCFRPLLPIWNPCISLSKSGEDVTKVARTICNIPIELLEDGIAVSEDPAEKSVELYGRNLSRTKSKALSDGH